MCGKYDPKIHHRRSIRLDSYDYSQEGWYFVTMCVQGHMCMFGDIVNDQMRLNESGIMVSTWWERVGSKFPSVQTDGYIIMPNHFHGIVNVKGQPHGVAPTNNATGQHCGRLGQACEIAPTLGDIVNWFKTMTTNQYIRGVKQNRWSSFGGKLWQRNYYEHIIRSEDELNHVRQYIADNPFNWGTDEENPDVTAR